MKRTRETVTSGTYRMITLNGDNILCREFYDIINGGTSVWGVEIFRDGHRLGEMVETSLPDENDSEAVEDFNDELENWLFVNEL